VFGWGGFGAYLGKCLEKGVHYIEQKVVLMSLLDKTLAS